MLLCNRSEVRGQRRRLRPLDEGLYGPLRLHLLCRSLPQGLWGQLLGRVLRGDGRIGDQSPELPAGGERRQAKVLLLDS